MSASPPTGYSNTSSNRLDSEHNPGLTTGTTDINNTEGPLTPGHQGSAASWYEDGTVMSSPPPSINRQDHVIVLVNTEQGRGSQEPDWDGDSPVTPTPSAHRDHISALYLDPEDQDDQDSQSTGVLVGNDQHGEESEVNQSTP